MQTVSPALAGWLAGLFWLVAGIQVLVVLAAMNARSAFDAYHGSLTSFARYQDWSDADGLFALVNLLSLPARLALAVVLIVWTWKSHKAAASLDPGPRRWTAGWAIGGWFIPFASVVIPKLVISETERIATTPRHGRVLATQWQGRPVSRLGTAWWWLFIAMSVAGGVASTIDTGYELVPDAGAIDGYYLVWALAGVLGAVSAALGAVYTRDLSRALSPDSLYGQRMRRGVGTGTLAGTPRSTVDAWANRTAAASVFCELCREPMEATALRCPRCGKRRQPPTAPMPSDDWVG